MSLTIYQHSRRNISGDLYLNCAVETGNLALLFSDIPCIVQKVDFMVVKLAGSSLSFHFSERVPRMLRLNVWSSCLYSIGSWFASQQWCCLFWDWRCVIRPGKYYDTTLSFIYILSFATRRSIFPPITQQPLVGQGLLVETSRSHSFRHTTLGTLLLMIDDPDSDTSTWQHSQEKTIHAPAGFEPAIPANEWPQIPP
jgi:hypothetical protein